MCKYYNKNLIHYVSRPESVDIPHKIIVYDEDIMP